MLEWFAAYEGVKHSTICKDTQDSLIKSNQNLSGLERERRLPEKGISTSEPSKGSLSLGVLLIVNCCLFPEGLRD